MRWFVEVSRVGENGAAEKYCVEARQWQAALQEARKLRGDSGPLSKFSIELLDEGYRAVDPAMKIRYLVAEAPKDAPLSLPADGSVRPPSPSVIPPVVIPVAAAVPAVSNGQPSKPPAVTVASVP